MKAKKCFAIILILTSLTMMVGCKASTPSKISEQKDTISSKYSLDFDKDKYISKTITVNNKEVKYRAYENIVYVKNPVDTKYESMNIYIPEEYFEGKSDGAYTADTAPIFLPNTIGGYMPGEPGTIGDNSDSDNKDA